ncbi:hypothetical protein FNB79_00375 [Formosa sediminum]|uniref:Uncharacterized protein n=1 Tax=Formosa sediminum TaxID=2594004 RepID=A0A516GLZ9_9FLAO|nr:hypothetical protein [Formosa sediminum]QDO92505.1 hypothetical protein FNB79_00375 [Formosa sediminum]
MNDGELKLLGTLGYKFSKWVDYGSYLGNSFTHTKTTPFNSDSEYLKRVTTYVILKKQGYFNRIKVDYGNPEVAYRESLYNPKRILKVEDFIAIMF